MSDERIKRALPRLALLAALVLLMGSLYPLLRNKRFMEATAENIQSVEMPAQARTQDRLENNPARIAQWHLFGKARTVSQRKAQKTPRKAPETRLKLTLKGIAESNETAQAHAIIAAPGKGQQSYRIGDELPGHAKLYAIESHRILLDRNGRIEALSLPQPKPGSSISMIK
ncbi:MAG: hypothetical protein KZQ58_05730 [gamma proteobacterium symbiont of Bathyaustriella thionipta]|nr:hypothetical protein [gamma proteobacterium symbiont of Bathyaustriella thionipta]